jgi:hypothetical protein
MDSDVAAAWGVAEAPTPITFHPVGCRFTSNQ